MPRHLLLLLPLLPALLHAAAPAPARPNIVVILADDLGFSDLGCYGGEIPTPHLDALGARGVKFRSFYNSARCCPTRAALLTGVAPQQAGVGYMTADFGPDHPGYRGRLLDRVATIPEALRPAGYFTAMVGKWHLGQAAGATPWNRGFDRSLNAAAGGFFFTDDPKAALFLNGRPLDHAAEFGGVRYTTDLWTDYALRFAAEARAAQKPFFLYVAHNAPHFPLQAPAADIAAWRGKFAAGWDRLRDERLARQKASGLMPAAATLAPRPPEVAAWDTLPAAERDRFDHLMAIYAAVVTRLDRAVGDLVAGLEKLGALENTVVFFLSDNGANAESGPAGRLNGANPGQVGSSVFLGQSWATLGSTPFARYKHFTHEGGIASPLLVAWPAGLPAAQRGRWVSAPGHVSDILPTVLELAGAPFPTRLGGIDRLPPEGVSLVPAIMGQPLHRPQPLCWEHEGNRAVRAGDLKLVSKLGLPWELYDLAADRTEQRDLAAERPAAVAPLVALYEAWAARAFVEPWRGGPRDNAGRVIGSEDDDGKSATAPAAKAKGKKKGKSL